MPVNSDKPQGWKKDIARSVDLYNDWFIKFAPLAYRSARAEATVDVERALKLTNNLTDLSPSILQQNPSVLPMLRMSTAPPIARDRLIGLAGVPAGLVFSMEISKRLPRRASDLESNLKKISRIILKLCDRDIFTWLDSGLKPKRTEIHRAATIVADRLCVSVSDPIVRNAQERRQLAGLKKWLESGSRLNIRSTRAGDILISAERTDKARRWNQTDQHTDRCGRYAKEVARREFPLAYRSQIRRGFHKHQ
jgi:hypothetical protein